MSIQKLSTLNKKDLLELMDIANISLFCADINSLRGLFSQLSRLMPFKSVCCAYGDIRHAVDQDVPDVDILDISYPENYLDHYLGSCYHLTDPVIAKYLNTLRPVDWNCYVTLEDKKIKYTESIDVEPLGMRDGWTYGTVSPCSGESAMFFMASENYDSSQRGRAIIEYIIPFMAEAYKRIINKNNNRFIGKPDRITPSEIEILNWLKDGKTSWEISVILNKSERVVNFHINNVIKKLNAMNRTHAVVMALKENLISL